MREVELKNSEILILRKPITSDAEEIIDYLNIVGGESDNLLFGANEFHFTVEKEREYIENLNNTPHTIMILAFIENDLVGIGQISGNDRKRIAHNCELAISVRKKYWGKGIGSIMMEELIRFAKDHNTIKSISLGVKSDNINAIKLYKKYGFVEAGIHKNYFNVNSIFYDKVLLDLYL